MNPSLVRQQIIEGLPEPKQGISACELFQCGKKECCKKYKEKGRKPCKKCPKKG
ncbi:hypothetical protein BH09BAC1_BH09BAC1_29970 [soil metagenome]